MNFIKLCSLCALRDSYWTSCHYCERNSEHGYDDKFMLDSKEAVATIARLESDIEAVKKLARID